MNRLEADLEIALLKRHQRWKTELGYNAEFFRQMFIRTKSKRYRRPLGTVRHVLHAYNVYTQGPTLRPHFRPGSQDETSLESESFTAGRRRAYC